MDIVTIDFETYYDKEYSLRRMPTDAYVFDDRFEVIGVAVKINDGETAWYSGRDWIGFLSGIDYKDKAVLAHNCIFDATILRHAGIRPKIWLDTLSMARVVHGPDVSVSLANLAKMHGLQAKGDAVVHALGKHREDFSPAELAEYGDYCIGDVDITYDLFQILVRQTPKQELKLIDLTLRMFVEPELRIQSVGLASYLRTVRKRKQAILDMVAGVMPDTESMDMDNELVVSACVQLRMAFPDGVDRKALMSNPKFAAALERLGVDAPMKISPRTGRPTFAFAKTDKDFLALQEHPNPAVQGLVAARLGTKSTIEETRIEGMLDAAKRGAMPVGLNYFGAKTGRWSGGAGGTALNWQNLPNRSELKTFITAPEGHMLVGADLSNIELRVGLWLAGEMEKLRALGEGLDLYKDFASTVFDVPYDEVTAEQRFIGKTSNLSLIYGVGAAKLLDALIMGAKNFLGIDLDITLDECQRIVAIYRKEHRGVVDCWDQGKNALYAMATGDTIPLFHKGLGEASSEGMRLPSGAHIRYRNLRQEEQEGRRNWICDVRRGTDKLYGAKIFQQFTQGTARCVLSDRLPAIHKRVPIKLTIHDANYGIVPEGIHKRALAFMLKQMTTPPEWMPDIPLDAEGGWGKNLKECGRTILATQSGRLIHKPTGRTLTGA